MSVERMSEIAPVSLLVLFTSIAGSVETIAAESATADVQSDTTAGILAEFSAASRPAIAAGSMDTAVITGYVTGAAGKEMTEAIEFM
jgi:hypothetical protein